jgi:hypothetical protein
MIAAQTNIRMKLTGKQDLIGTWDEIKWELKKFYKDCPFTFAGTHDGILLRFLASSTYTPYIFTEENKGKLLLRKRHNAFMIPGDCGQINYLNKDAIFKVEEISKGMNINVEGVIKIYNVKIAPKPSSSYY